MMAGKTMTEMKHQMCPSFLRRINWNTSTKYAHHSQLDWECRSNEEVPAFAGMTYRKVDTFSIA